MAPYNLVVSPTVFSIVIATVTGSKHGRSPTRRVPRLIRRVSPLNRVDE
jgi:hypothetical protein